MSTDTTSTTAITLGFDRTAVAKIDAVADACRTELATAASTFGKALVLARGMRQLRELVTPEMVGDLMTIQNTPLGFLTDKPGGPGYPSDVVRDVAIEARIRGFLPVGNEFNIISGRFYAAQSGFARLIREWPGLTDLRIMLGVPRTKGDKGALVDVIVEFNMDGKPRHLEFCGDEWAIPVRVNAGMGVDAILGKAKRKALARIHEWLSGSSWSEADADYDEPGTTTIDAKSTASDGLAEKLGAKPAQAARPEPKAAATAPTVPEPDEAAQSEPPDSDMLLREYREQLCRCEAVNECNRFGQHAAENPGLSAEHKAVVHAAVQAACERIRGKRGKGSNGGDLFPKGNDATAEAARELGG